jgi:hypothetical protein
MRPNIEVPPKISFDLSRVVTLNESFATGGTIFSQGDIAETLMYIQGGRVKLSVASKTDKEAVVAILGPGEFSVKCALEVRKFVCERPPRLHPRLYKSLKETR